ncbi:zinc finger protein CONSTANS-LIKE 16 [Oryza brachyantha]|uniref:zinc finger protein CONSTANS-LIKE 16 n=1 Tax=Oryza brachyantha TaxID=4533 RepID=UPI001ADD1B23|nr:zinc finger protein CONSTANS-LIKE 16 [Oryza brachyantha]
MGSSAKAAAGAMGAKAARACDGCLRRRARWYCAADDAFLCQWCDTSVHSANPLARRHERLRLRPSSPQMAPPSGGRRGEVVAPAWFKRKARTPRSHGKSVGQVLSTRRLVVPEVAVGVGVDSPEERKDEGEIVEEQLLYRVPVFDPALAEFCSPPPLEDAAAAGSCCNEDGAVENPTKMAVTTTTTTTPPPPLQFFPDSHANFGPTDAELREFAADMEALLGRGLDDGNDEDSFCMETLGLIEPVEDDGGRVKVEADGDAGLTLPWCNDLDPETSSGEMLDIDFDCGSPQAATPDEKVASSGAADALQSSLALSLNYEAIIESWGSSPWTDGERPHVKLNDSWPHDYSGVWMAAAGVFGHGEEQQALTPRLQGMDGGREARVSRYREKRRTRLFSKKIRYEVRKLNAEKRPRMKGRFVKRATAAIATALVA